MPHKAKDTRQIRLENAPNKQKVRNQKTCNAGLAKICRKGKATHLKSKRKASILNLGQPRKTEGRDL